MYNCTSFIILLEPLLKRHKLDYLNVHGNCDTVFYFCVSDVVVLMLLLTT